MHIHGQKRYHPGDRIEQISICADLAPGAALMTKTPATRVRRSMSGTSPTAKPDAIQSQTLILANCIPMFIE
jgi:hypothetical protein